MKKYIILFAVIAAFILAVSVSCQKASTISMTSAEIMGAAGPTDTPTPTHTPDTSVCAGFTFTGMLDDMEDGDNGNLIPSPCGPGYWYVYDDLADGGSSYAVPWSDARWAAASMSAQPYAMQSPGRNGSAYAARITGYVTTAFTYGFVGMGNTMLTPKGPVDISGITGIRFWEMGDGKQYRMKISSSSTAFLLGAGDNFYGYAFNSHATWYQQDILLTMLTQEAYWGTSVALATAMAMATDIQWQTVGQPIASIELWIDEVEFY